MVITVTALEQEKLELTLKKSILQQKLGEHETAILAIQKQIDEMNQQKRHLQKKDVFINNTYSNYSFIYSL